MHYVILNSLSTQLVILFKLVMGNGMFHIFCHKWQNQGNEACTTKIIICDNEIKLKKPCSDMLHVALLCNQTEHYSNNIETFFCCFSPELHYTN